eukprot:IDg12138t1
MQLGTARQALAYIPAHRRSPRLSTSSYAERIGVALAMPGCKREDLCGALHLRALALLNPLSANLQLLHYLLHRGAHNHYIPSFLFFVLA